MSADIQRKMFEIMASGVGHGFAELKQSILPEKLYKYQPVNSYTIDALQNSYLWMSPVPGLNDPYDSKVGFDIEADNKELNEAVCEELLGMAVRVVDVREEEFMKLWFSQDLVSELRTLITTKYPNKLTDFNRLIQRIMNSLERHEGLIRTFNNNVDNNVKICSLSEVNDSITMWSHYSSNHQGICLEFGINEFDESDLVQFYPVNYSSEFIDVGKYLRKGVDIYLICLLAGICKNEQWSYEKEWRFVRMMFGKGLQLPSPKPNAIYFGSECNFADESIKKIIDIANTRGIKKMRMVKYLDKYGLKAIEFP